ncbi:MAG: hypothetical protein Q4C50_06500 [Eubacteriales bacterium]|nr:hypothetical protein [Eubacteriales bacterium]
MKKNVKKMMTLSAAAGLLALQIMPASAEESYSYLAGQARGQSRTELYAQAENYATEEAREAFLAAHGIGDTEYSEENAASYSYVGGRQRGSAYRQEDSSENPAAADGTLNYVIGRQRGASYSK